MSFISLLSWKTLGRDFWLFRLGQLVSALGDSCSNIAIAWWILGKTGSASQMALVMAPVTFVQITLIPVFGPIGDRFSRKWIVVIGDSIRLMTAASLSIMAYLDIFNLPLIIGIYITHAAGTALFLSASESIIPKIVKTEHIQTAFHQEQMIAPIGTVLGGLVGGVSVTALGPAGAFGINAISFLVASVASFFIQADTMPHTEDIMTRTGNAFQIWRADLIEGFKIIRTIPVEIGVAVVLGLLNFALAPVDISIAYFIKQDQNQPAWLLGTMETFSSVGTFVGSLILAYLFRRLRKSDIIVVGIVAAALAITIIPQSSGGIILPNLMMLCYGMGIVFANVPLKSQPAIAMPDAFRARAGSVRSFVGSAVIPAGIALSGYLIETIGVRASLTISGILVALLAFGLYLIPNYRRFFDASPEETSNFYKTHYPKAFEKLR